MLTITRRQALAHRLRGQHLIAQGDDPFRVLECWLVQDSPPGAGIAALHARTTGLEPDWLDRALYEDRSVVALYNARTATAILPVSEAAAYGTSMIPTDETGLKAIVGPALPDIQEGFAEPVALAVAAVADALDGTTLSRDELHEALRQRLPPEVLPWCKGCESHHARRGLLVMAGLHGKLCIAERWGRQPAFARTDQLVGWDPPTAADARGSLVLCYLRAYGPSTPKHFAEWAGLGTAHARALWDAVADELTPIELEGAGQTWMDDLAAPMLEMPSIPTDTRVLAPGDPFLLSRDRELLVADPDVRKKLWPAINPPGLVLSGVEPAALWRGRKQGKTLAVTVEPFGPAPVDRKRVEKALSRLAPLRGCTSATVSWA